MPHPPGGQRTELIREGDQTRSFYGVGGGLGEKEYFIRAAAISLPRPTALQILSIPVDAASCKWREKKSLNGQLESHSGGWVPGR